MVTQDLAASSANFEDVKTASDLYAAIQTIGEQVIESADAGNPLAAFDKGYLDTGTIVEKILFNVAESTAYNKNANSGHTPVYPTPVVAYLNDWTAKDFWTAVNEDEARTVLVKGGDVADITARVIGTLNNGEIDEDFTNYKALFKKFKDTAGWHSAGQIIGQSTGIPALLNDIRNVVKGMTFKNTKYTQAQNYSYRVPRDEIRIVMPYEVVNAIMLSADKMEMLSRIFGLDADEIGDRIIETDDPANSDGTYNIYVTDVKTFGKWTRARALNSAYNLAAGAQEYKLHTEAMFAYVKNFKAACLTYMPTEQALTNEH